VYVHMHPSLARFTALLAFGSVFHRTGLRVPGGVFPQGHHCTESRFACGWVLPPHSTGLVPVSAGITPPFSLLPAHAPDRNPLASFGPSKGCLVRRVFAGCDVPLLGVGPSRRYLHSLCVGAWTLTPRRLFGALARFFPKNIGLTLDLRGSARSVNHQYTILMAHAFRGCSHFFMFRLPHLLDPPIVPTAGTLPGPPGRLHHAMDLELPPRTVASLRA
jgi:hypothetical protein